MIEYENAHDMLLPYFDRLWGVIRGGWGDWTKEVSDLVRARASPRSRATMIHDFMRWRSGKLAEEDQTVKVLVRQQMFVLVFAPKGFNGRIGIRLKKLDENGLSKNQPTKQILEFRGQLALPEIEADYHLEAGYVVDRFGMELTSVDLVCPSGAGIYWKAEIMPHEASHNVQSLFSASNEQQPMKEVRVRKKSDKDSGEKYAAGGEN